MKHINHGLESFFLFSFVRYISDIMNESETDQKAEEKRIKEPHI